MGKGRHKVGEGGHGARCRRALAIALLCAAAPWPAVVKAADRFPDDHGDEPAEATPILADGVPSPGVIEIDTDPDWFRFEAQAGVTYGIEVTAISIWDTALEVRGPDGVAVLQTADSSRSREPSSATATLTAGADGPWYVGISGYLRFTTGTYSIAVQALTRAGQAPLWTQVSPSTNPPAVTEGAAIPFSVTASDSSDPDAARGMVSIAWQVDGDERQVTTSGAPGDIVSAFTFQTDTNTVQGAPFKDVVITAVAVDTQGATTTATWMARVADYQPLVGKARLAAVAEPPAGGTIAGAGLYAPGAQAKLSARAQPGYTFLRWDNGSQIALRSLVVPNSNVSVTAFFKQTADIAPPVITAPGAQTAIVGVPFTLALEVESECLPTVTVTGLPAGLKYDAARRSISGVPLVAVTNAVVTISARNSAGKVAAPLTFGIAVHPLPPWAWGTFNGLCAVGPKAEAGVASMAVTKQGKVTGKFLAGGTQYAFSQASYAAGSDPAGGFICLTKATAGKLMLPLALAVRQAVSADGPHALSVAHGWLGDSMTGEASLAMHRRVWDDADMTAAAAGLDGYYTAALPDLPAAADASDAFGSGYLAFTLSKGNLKAAGKLADGTAVSLSSPLLVDASNRVFAVLYAAPKAYMGGSLFGVAEFVRPALADAPVVVRPLNNAPWMWESRNQLATAVYGAAFDRRLSLVGGWYDKVGNLYAYYEGKRLAVGTSDSAPAPELVVGTNRHEAACWDPGDLPLAAVTNTSGVLTGIAALKPGAPTDPERDGVWDYTADNAVGLTFTLIRPTGVFKGAFRAWFDYGATHTSRSIGFEGMMTPARADATDGAEGHGFYLWADKAVPALPLKPYNFNRSYDFVIRAGR